MATMRPDAGGEAWVEATLAAMGERDRLAQLFNLLVPADDPERVAAARAFRPGGVTPMGGATAEGIARLAEGAAVPLLVSADLEGSRMSLPGGTSWPNALALAAADDPDLTREVSARMAREARARGINWTFTPVLDLAVAHRSPIVATRSFGADPERVRAQAVAQIEGLHAGGVAATLKHWPGEGIDDRDQHLVTTINPLTVEEWEATFGRLYRAGIAAGAPAVMSAHIALPAFAQAAGLEGADLYLPATLSRALTGDLLRRRLGFDGLVVSDATGMAGLGQAMPRRDALPALVMAGCDVILFQRDAEEDLGFLRAALEDGRLTWERVEDAVRRQLRLKAALGLHRGEAAPAPDPEGDAALAREALRRAPTLVKDVQGTLPLDPARHRRLLVIAKGVVFPFGPGPLPFALPDLLRARGFEVTAYEPGTAITRDAFDAVLVLHGEETLLTRGRIFLDWLSLMGHFGRAMERWWHDVPTVLVSFGTPFLLYDAPRMPAVVNAYASSEAMQEAVAEALCGAIPFRGTSPVDAFCGLPDARY